jgi:hypothetical protein
MALLTRRRFVAALVAGVSHASAMSQAEAQAPLEPGHITGGQPAGLFYRVEVAVVGPRRVDTRTWLFLPLQRVSRVYPYGAVFDPARCSGDTCGSYQIAGVQLAVRWDGGRVLQWAVAATAEGITLDGALYRPARPMTGAALVGRWVDGAGSNVYVFDANGRFSFGALGGGGLTGTYQLRGFALTLTFADGDTRRRTLFVASAGEPVGLISVEGEVYSRN